MGIFLRKIHTLLTQVLIFVKATILMDFKVKIPMTDIAKRYFVSPAFCWKIVDKIKLCSQFHTLPDVLLFDKFKATQNSDNGLAFVCSDGLTYDILDIVESRRQDNLIAYFSKFSCTVRGRVRTVVMDMNANPVLLTFFPNTQLVIDGSHVIQQFFRAFNQLRIQEMNRLKKIPGDNGKIYRKLKKYWRQLLKQNGKVNYQHGKPWSLFYGKWRTEDTLIDLLLSHSRDSQDAYEVYQDGLDAFQESKVVFETIEKLPESLPQTFEKTCYLFRHREAVA
jgi:transposase